MGTHLLKGLALALGSCAILAGCSSQPPQSVEYIQPRETFQGTLPCASCSGVDTTLILERDAVLGAPGHFFLHRQYRDDPGGARVASQWGEWKLQACESSPQRGCYVLTPENGSESILGVGSDGSLYPLQLDGQPAKGKATLKSKTERL